MIDNDHNNVTEKLIELGFTPHEADVYLSVVGNGEASAGMVLNELNLHREQVYRALKRLTDRGCLINYTKQKKKYYSPADPKLLIQRAQDQVATAQSVLPILQTMRLVKPQTIQVYEGEDGLQQNLVEIRQILKKEGEYLVLGSVGESFYKTSKRFLRKENKLYQQKGITGRAISFTDVPYTPGQPEEGPVLGAVKSGGAGTATVIYGDRISLQILDPNNLALITITNQRIADSYRHTFETLWQTNSPAIEKKYFNGLVP